MMLRNDGYMEGNYLVMKVWETYMLLCGYMEIGMKYDEDALK